MEANKGIRENQCQRQTRNQGTAKDGGWADAEGVNPSARHGRQRNQTGDGEISERCGTPPVPRETGRIPLADSLSPVSLPHSVPLGNGRKTWMRRSGGNLEEKGASQAEPASQPGRQASSRSCVKGSFAESFIYAGGLEE